MNATELREALGRFEDWVQNSDVAALRFEDIERLADGAAIALPILEADSTSNDSRLIQTSCGRCQEPNHVHKKQGAE